MRSADSAWRRWGEIDPYYAVLTAPQFEGENLESSKAEFFASGTAHIDRIVRLIQAHYPDAQFGRALDFGCGVGRLTVPLAHHYAEAIGVDISPGMLAEAQTNALAAGAENVRFVLSDDRLTAVEPPLDLVHTFIVLQHIPVARGLAYIERMVSLLRVGGVASLHFTVDRQGGVARDLLHWAKSHLPLVNSFANVARGRSWSEPMMQMNEYPLLTVLRLLEANGIEASLVSLDRQLTTLAISLLGQKVR